VRRKGRTVASATTDGSRAGGPRRSRPGIGAMAGLAAERRLSRQRQFDAALACPKARRQDNAAALRSDQQCRERNAGNTPASGNEGVGEHVRTRFHFDREATREIAEPENRSRTERRKLVSSAGPDFGERTRERERSDR
jgi:hypothetical protein